MKDLRRATTDLSVIVLSTTRMITRITRKKLGAGMQTSILLYLGEPHSPIRLCMDSMHQAFVMTVQSVVISEFELIAK